MANTKVTTRVIADDAITSDKLASGLTLGGDTTLSGHVDLADDKRIRLGASDDLQIYHTTTGNHSIIAESGAGNLVLAADHLEINNAANNENKIIATSDGAVTLFHNNQAKIATALGGVTITGTATATTFAGELSGTITSATTGTTQSASDNSTKVATTAYVTTAIANLVDSSPSALNTLNELAAALGDDANFSTTVTNSIATKLPLAGGTMTGALNMGSQNITNAGTIASGAITADGNITADYNDTISLNYSVSNGDYHKGMSGTSFASGNTARGLHLFNFDNDSNFGINFWVGTTASKVFAARIDYAGNLGLGNDSPTNYYSTFRNLVIGSSGSNGITVVSGTTGAGTVAFADGTSGDAQYRGYIQYNHNGDSLALGSAGGDRVTIDSSGNATFTGNITFGDGHTIGNDGSDNLTIASSTSEHIILDSAQDIVLDADNADIFFKDGGTTFMTANSANGLIIGTGEVNESIRLDHYSSSQSDITGLVAGSTFGSIIYGGTNGHIVMALRDNDIADSFSVISGSGNYMTDTTFDQKVFSVRADGTANFSGTIGSGAITVAHQGSNGAANSQYGILTTATGGSTQATLGAHHFGDSYANLNLSSVVSGDRKMWHISKRKATDSNRLEFYWYENGGFNGPRYKFETDGVFSSQGGIKPANSGNTLDDYEEGAWTPSLTGNTGAPTVSYQFRSGYYIKVGNVCMIRFGIRLLSISGGSGVATVTGLPFTAKNYGSFQQPALFANAQGLTTNLAGPALFYVVDQNTQLQGRIMNNADTVLPLSYFQAYSWLIGNLTYDVS